MPFILQNGDETHTIIIALPGKFHQYFASKNFIIK